jgi:hypothetical protein
VTACAEDAFAVHPARTVDEALEILTGMEAGEADEAGDFPEATVNARVLDQLVQFAVIAESFAKLVKITAQDEVDDEAQPVLSSGDGKAH